MFFLALFFVILLITLFIYVAVFFKITIQEAFSISPSFGHQENRDAPFDIKDVKCIKASGLNNCEITRKGNQSIDILSIDFSSDGRFLNASVWLISPIA